MRIWIAETHGGLCGELAPALAAAGCEVQCVGHGNAPLPPVRATDCDLLILGIELPGSQGLERLRRFESGALSRQVPVVIIANRPELEYELPDAFDFLCVPVDMARLLAGVRQARHAPRPQVEALKPLEGAELSLFQDFLVQHSGLHFDERNLRILQRGLTRRMRALGLTAYGDYFDYLRTFRETRRELKKLLGLLTVGETYFFRYLAHFEALRHQLLPALIARNARHGSLRLWSAGCSTGEEPYTLAILLRTWFPQLRDWQLRILATDINHQALNKARQGVYGPRSLRVTDASLMKTWFAQRGSQYVLDEQIRRMVDFRYLNLQTDCYPDAHEDHGDFDIIFCRNVLIYFRPATSRKVVAGFARSLAAGGSLFLGHAETLMHLSQDFQRVSYQRSFYYQLPIHAPAATAPPGIRAAEQTTEASRESLERPAPPVVETAPKAASEAGVDVETLYRQGLEAFHREDFALAENRFGEILAAQPAHVGALVGLGFVFANRNDFEQARAWCARALAADDLSAQAYFLKGLLCELEDSRLEACEEYRKALLIDLDFIMPHYHLGRLYERLGRPEAARRELRNSLRLLERLPEEALVPLSGGLTREVFLEVCRDQLNQLP